jgi:transposase InsO family protein
VVVIRSNLRWCSDALEFTCWNGEIVRVAFIIDSHDREIVAWRAVTGAGISGSDVRDMMLEAVETRFGALRAPHKIEFLTDNASAYTAQDTRIFAAQLGLVPCFTPVASPESNRLAEAFVRTFKRDYLRVNPVPSAEAALAQTAGRFVDYNELHPHSRLRMRSPREFRRGLTTSRGVRLNGGNNTPVSGHHFLGIGLNLGMGRYPSNGAGACLLANTLVRQRGPIFAPS